MKKKIIRLLGIVVFVLTAVSAQCLTIENHLTGETLTMYVSFNYGHDIKTIKIGSGSYGEIDVDKWLGNYDNYCVDIYLGDPGDFDKKIATFRRYVCYPPKEPTFAQKLSDASVMEGPWSVSVDGSVPEKDRKWTLLKDKYHSKGDYVYSTEGGKCPTIVIIGEEDKI